MYQKGLLFSLLVILLTMPAFAQKERIRVPLGNIGVIEAPADWKLVPPDNPHIIFHLIDRDPDLSPPVQMIVMFLPNPPGGQVYFDEDNGAQARGEFLKGMRMIIPNYRVSTSRATEIDGMPGMMIMGEGSAYGITQRIDAYGVQSADQSIFVCFFCSPSEYNQNAFLFRQIMASLKFASHARIRKPAGSETLKTYPLGNIAAISAPADWKQLPPNNKNNLLLLQRDTPKPNRFVAMRDTELANPRYFDETSVGGTMDGLLRGIKTVAPEFREQNILPLEISGRKAIFISGHTSIQGVPLKMDFYVIYLGNEVLILTFAGLTPQYAQDEVLYKQILGSLRFGENSVHTTGSSSSKPWKTFSMGRYGSLSAPSDWTAEKSAQILTLRCAADGSSPPDRGTLTVTEDNGETVFPEGGVKALEEQLRAQDPDFVSCREAAVGKLQGIVLVRNREFGGAEGKEIIYSARGKQKGLRFLFRCSDADYETNGQLFDRMIGGARINL